MIIDYDHNPSLTAEQKLQSLKESVQMALNEAGSGTSTIIYRGGGDVEIDSTVLALYTSLGWVQD